MKNLIIQISDDSVQEIHFEILKDEQRKNLTIIEILLDQIQKIHL